MPGDPREVPRTVPTLAHAAPDCRGRWEEVKSVVRVEGKRRTVHHVRCSACEVTVPRDHPGAWHAVWQQQRFEMGMRKAAMEAKAERWMAAQIRKALPHLSEDDAVEAASAAMSGLRRGFYYIAEDRTARGEWQRAWQDRLQDVYDLLRHTAEQEAPGAHFKTVVDQDNGIAQITVTFPADAPESAVLRLQMHADTAFPPQADGLEIDVHVTRAALSAVDAREVP